MRERVRNAGSDPRELERSSTARLQCAGVYLASANWQQLTYLAGIAIAVAHYITPGMAAVIVPALAHHWFQALVGGRQALAQAVRQASLRNALLRAEKKKEEEDK